MSKYSKLAAVMLISAAVASCIGGCGKKETAEEDGVKTSAYTDSNYIEATERTKGWFEDAAGGYVKIIFGDETDFKLYSRVYDVRTGVSESNVLQYVSADVSLYFRAEDVQTQEIADFSDNFARKFASDGAGGDIKFNVYTIPGSIYDQIEEGNHIQVEEKAKETEGYSKFGFKYSGIGDAVYSVPADSGNSSEIGTDAETADDTASQTADEVSAETATDGGTQE